MTVPFNVLATTKLVVILDDGHGMGTPGKRTAEFTDGTKSPETGKNYMHENEFNRAVVKYMGADLGRHNVEVHYTSPTDADDSLATRVSRANAVYAKYKAGVEAGTVKVFFISIHANANTGKWGTWGGTETYTWPSGESLRVGKVIHKHLMGGTTLRDRGVKNGDWLYLIKNTDMPAVLVEAAYMDNLQEAKLLLSDAFRRETAREVVTGFLEGYGVKYQAPVAAKPAPAPAPANLYRVRTDWDKVDSQIGAFAELDNAIDLAKSKSGYKVFDKAGKQVWPEDQIYRVRKSWADAASQIGAFAELQNAKDLTDKNPGYTVYDKSGKAIYTYVAPAPKPAPQPAPAPAPAPEPKPEPVDPHLGHVNILGKTTQSAEKMVAFVKRKNANAQDIEKIAASFVALGQKYGIRGDMALCQSLIETGWFKFDGGTAVTPDQHNYCGMGVTSKGMKGNSFTTVEDGVRAQIQHLFAYASKDALPQGEEIVDPRFKYVTRGIAPHWEDLSNRWAMNPDYGKHIVNLYAELVSFNYVPPVVEKPKPEPVPEPKPEPVPTPEPAPVPEPTPVPVPEEEKINVSLLNKVLQMIHDFLKNLLKK